jgi:H/ACA ribonucleoprotein complex subunit 1
MGKQFEGNNNRGQGNFRGGRGGGRGGGNFRQQDQGPPAFVIPYGTFVHRC